MVRTPVAILMPPPNYGRVAVRVSPLGQKCYTVTTTGKPEVHTSSEYLVIMEYEHA